MKNKMLWQVMFALTAVATAASLAFADCDSAGQAKPALQRNITVANTGANINQCKAGNGWFVLNSRCGSTGSALIDLKPESIVSGQPFSFNVRFCAETTARPDRVTASATMPAHKHSMNYTPTVTPLESSTVFADYRVNGFVFHMPGLWEISLSAYRNGTVSQYTYLVTLK